MTAEWEKPSAETSFAETPPLEEGRPPPEREAPTPEWLNDLEARPPVGVPALILEEGELPGEGAAYSVEVPEWLSTFKPGEGEAGKATTEIPAEGAEALAPAELPSWVQAMRPVEAVALEVPAAEEEEQTIESEGPLAGFRGVLPAQPGIGPLRKPQTRSIKLQVSESEQVHARRLYLSFGRYNPWAEVWQNLYRSFMVPVPQG